MTSSATSPSHTPQKTSPVPLEGSGTPDAPLPSGGLVDGDESAHPGPRIGPNAVFQTLAALTDREGPDVARKVAETADLPEVDLEGLIPEAWFVRLIDALRAELPSARAEAVLAEAGHRTAAYVARRRIPVVFRSLLALLPARLALPLILAAFRRHAWTFAGAGRFTTAGRYPGRIELEMSPTCRPRPSGGPPEVERGGAYYAAAFAGLLALAAPGVRVQETTCACRGAERCTFIIEISPSR